MSRPGEADPPMPMNDHASASTAAGIAIETYWQYASNGVWEEWPGNELAGCDLGLSRASAGMLSALRVCASGEDAGEGPWHCYDLDFDFLYVLRGVLALENERGERHELSSGSSFAQPSFFWHRDLFRSGDLEVLYVTGPAVGERFDGRDTELPPRAALRAGRQPGVYRHPGPKAERPGSGPDAACGVRDLRIAGPTEGRLGAEVRTTAQAGTASGWNQPSSTSWSMVLAGQAWAASHDQPPRLLGSGDVFGIDRGSRWAITPDTDDFRLLTLISPA